MKTFTTAEARDLILANHARVFASPENLETRGIIMSWRENDQDVVDFSASLLARSSALPSMRLTPDRVRRMADFRWVCISYAGDDVPEWLREEPAKAPEPQWRPCTKEFALAHPNESQVQFCSSFQTWEENTRPWVEVGAYNYVQAPEQYRFRTKAPVVVEVFVEVFDEDEDESVEGQRVATIEHAHQFDCKWRGAGVTGSCSQTIDPNATYDVVLVERESL